jgi:hypothetical protein
MSTRALVGYLDPETKELTSTYNHSDGYPSNLGKALDNHYSDDSKAYGIANYGYISYVDPETGEIEARNEGEADISNLKDMSFEDAMYEIAQLADSYGADYIYIYNPKAGMWENPVRMYSISSTTETLMGALASLKDIFDSNLEENYTTKWNKFIGE